MILLAGDGTPLYPQGTHLHLKWPHNNMLTAEPQSNVQHQGVLGMDHVAEPLSPVGRHDVEGASLRHAGHAADDALSNRSARGWFFFYASLLMMPGSTDVPEVGRVVCMPPDDALFNRFAGGTTVVEDELLKKRTLLWQ